MIANLVRCVGHVLNLPIAAHPMKRMQKVRGFYMKDSDNAARFFRLCV